MDLEDPTTWPVGVFTCETRGCENENVPIELAVPSQDPVEALVFCGACSTEISRKART